MKDLHQKVYLRDEGLCQVCFKKVSFKEAVFHHKIYRCNGGPTTFDNLQTRHAICERRDQHKRGV